MTTSDAIHELIEAGRGILAHCPPPINPTNREAYAGARAHWNECCGRALKASPAAALPSNRDILEGLIDAGARFVATCGEPADRDHREWFKMISQDLVKHHARARGISSKRREIVRDLIAFGNAVMERCVEPADEDGREAFLEAMARLGAVQSLAADGLDLNGTAPPAKASGTLRPWERVCLDLLSRSIKITRGAEPGTVEVWEPDSCHEHPAGANAYYQVCSECQGGFDTVHAAASFCPWCGAELPAPTAENEWTLINVDKACAVAAAQRHYEKPA